MPTITEKGLRQARNTCTNSATNLRENLLLKVVDYVQYSSNKIAGLHDSSKTN